MKDTKNIPKAEATASAFGVLTNRTDTPIYKTTLRAHRSLPRVGFVWLISVMAILFLLPIMALLGSIVMWGVLLPILITLAALWYFLERSYTDGTVHEKICVWHDLISVERVNPRAENQYWHANPHWVKTKMVDLKEVENYLTLSGGNREIEIGAFMTPKQRLDARYHIERSLRLANATFSDKD